MQRRWVQACPCCHASSSDIDARAVVAVLWMSGHPRTAAMAAETRSLLCMRRARRLQGSEPLLGERERRGARDVDSALAALPPALFAAVTQRDWERDVLWAAESSGDAATTALGVEEEDEEEQAAEPAEVQSAGGHITCASLSSIGSLDSPSLCTTDALLVPPRRERASNIAAWPGNNGGRAQPADRCEHAAHRVSCRGKCGGGAAGCRHGHADGWRTPGAACSAAGASSRARPAGAASTAAAAAAGAA